MLFGLGYALFEEVPLDGHRAFVRSLSDYRIPRFSDVPEIGVSFHDNLVEEPIPRGCGELPVIPTIGAIANAVAAAAGVRFHTLPITPEKMLRALGEALSTP
jgi:CO/xanthine dehydrogenase Mo-binding subunit